MKITEKQVMNLTTHEVMLITLVKDIEEEKLKITMRPDQDIWMGNIIYDIENGWKIIVFSDVFCWDYIDAILDENDNIIYKYHKDSILSDYQCSDKTAKEIYKIFDPALVGNLKN